MFDADMDTARVDGSKVYVPMGLTVSALTWIDSRTLAIQYTGFIVAFGAKRIDLADGYFKAAAGAPLPINSGFAFNYGNNDPVFVVNPSATPNPATAGQSVAFTCFSTDPDGDGTTCSWNFGDGSLGTGFSVNHTYSTAGPYLVIATLSDGKGGSRDFGMLMIVNAAPPPPGGGAAPPLPSKPWTVGRTSISLNFKLAGKDKIMVQGTAELPAGYDPAGKIVDLDIGGALASFTLDAKGRAKAGKNTFKVTRKLKKKVFAGGVVKFNFKLAGSFVEALKDDGLVNADSNGTVKVDMLMILGGDRFLAEDVPLTYKAKVGKTGRAKKTK
jgi:hypothetical protein